MIPRREFLKIGGLTLTLPSFVRGLLASPGQAEEELHNLTAGVQPPGPEDYAERLERAGRLMAAHNLDAVFLSGGTDLAYFTAVDWWSSERTFGAVLNKKGLPIWVCPAFELDRARESVPSGHAIRTWEEHESPYALIRGIMNDLGARRLGLSPGTAAFQMFGLKRDAPGVEQVDGAAVTEGCRGTKAAKEIAYMDLAAKITKLAYRKAFSQIREGMTPMDLAGLVAAAHEKLGARGGGGPQFGPNTSYPHGSRAPQKIAEGTVVMVDGGGSVEGYSSDVTRTIVFGKPTEKMLRVWDIVKKAQTAALRACRPGAACQDVDAAARKVIEDAGYGPGYRYFAHRLGHGIGLDVHEYPYLVKGNTLKLEPGMTFSNEPGIYIAGEFGIRHEDSMVVTEDGARYLGGMEALAIDRPFADQ
jgi:Xaa-Pro dipeptidase